uniref:Secreted protein n=1 Tax=Macrostomum lignano TaxID=282301 RepID=A0A1I8F8B7_9PLAT
MVFVTIGLQLAGLYKHGKLQPAVWLPRLAAAVTTGTGTVAAGYQNFIHLLGDAGPRLRGSGAFAFPVSTYYGGGGGRGGDFDRRQSLSGASGDPSQQAAVSASGFVGVDGSVCYAEAAAVD